MKLPSRVPAACSTRLSDLLILLRPRSQPVQFNLHRTLYIVAEFSTLIINETSLCSNHSLSNSSHFRIFNLTLKINPSSEQASPSGLTCKHQFSIQKLWDNSGGNTNRDDNTKWTNEQQKLFILGDQ
jgi:hypothetical protein